MKVTEVYTVEYSVVQHCYHVDTLDNVLKNNIEAVVNNYNNGFLIIGLFKSHDAASHFVDHHREFMSGLAKRESKKFMDFLLNRTPNDERSATQQTPNSSNGAGHHMG